MSRAPGEVEDDETAHGIAKCTHVTINMFMFDGGRHSPPFFPHSYIISESSKSLWVRVQIFLHSFYSHCFNFSFFVRLANGRVEALLISRSSRYKNDMPKIRPTLSSITFGTTSSGS